MKLKVVTEKSTYIFSYVLNVRKDDRYLYINNKGDKREHTFAIRDISQVLMSE